MSIRFGLATILIMALVGCETGSYQAPFKIGREVNCTFETDSPPLEPQSPESKLSLESWTYKQSITGHWRRIALAADAYEEVVIFVAVVSYSSQDDYDKIAAFLSKAPLDMNFTKLETQHNVTTLATDPDPRQLEKEIPGTSLSYFHGYARVKPQERPLKASLFKGIDGSSQPVCVKQNKFYYLRVIVLEETGYSSLGEIAAILKDKAPSPSDKPGDRLLRMVIVKGVEAIESQFPVIGQYGVKLLGGGIELLRDVGFDVEYDYESPRGAKEIPLVHQRIWENDRGIEENNLTLSFKLQPKDPQK